MGIDTEYDGEDDLIPRAAPLATQGDNAERGAQQINNYVDTGKHVAVIAWCAGVCGGCLLGAIVAAGIAWWSITENRVTQERLQTVNVEHEAFKSRLESLEQERRNARH